MNLMLKQFSINNHLFRPLLFSFLSLFVLQDVYAQKTVIKGANSLKAHYRGKTKPLRDLAPMPVTSLEKRNRKKANKPNFTPPNFINWRKQPKVNMNALPKGDDPVRQYEDSRSGIPVEPRTVIEGINEVQSSGGVPDTNGDVSPDHYIQIVNASTFQIFDKQGNALIEPTSANTIWSQINQQSFSDPVIMYDEEADRWLLTDLADINHVLYGVSETSDPMGAWNLYELITPFFADYPKYGIWPNSYIFTINEALGDYPVYGLNRQQMLDGESTIDVQRVEIPGISGGFPSATPMDWNSPTPPPSDDVFVVRLNDDAWGNGNPTDELEVWTINFDWANPNNTTSTSLRLPTAAYDTDGCSVDAGQFECIPQPGTTQGIDGIMTIVMNNVCYWNYGTHESAVLTFSVDAGGDIAGIRWMELRRTPGNDWSIYQEGTFAPEDDIHRFIGGIAINGKGDIGLAYCVSNEETFPGLRFTGRRAADPLGEMSIQEYEFAKGEGVRIGNPRYGDYAHMSVDPTDGSFWFTSEYTQADGTYGTKIVNFLLRKDTFDIGPISLDSPQDASDLTNNETVTISVKNLGIETARNITVGYAFENEAPVMEQASIDSLMPDSVYVHTFSQTVDMLNVGSYNFKLFATFPEDESVSNDTINITRTRLSRYDSGISNLEGLDLTLCENSVTVPFTLSNYGTETLTSASIQYQLNGGATQSMDWTGSLATGENTVVDILINSLASGTNTLNAFTANPNGISDEIPSNDNYSKEFMVVLGGANVTFNLSFDYYPEETSWQLLDENNNVLYAGGTYPGQEFESITEQWCLVEDQCYKFILFDSYGDGNGDTGFGNGEEGYYEILDGQGNILASLLTVDFGSQEDNEFCLQAPCDLTADFDVTDESDVNNSDGAILITPTSGKSPFTYSLDGSAPQSEPLFSNLTGATYSVVITDADDCSLEEMITVGTLVSTDDLNDHYSISISPNPSKNGAFWVKVDGLRDSYDQLDLQVIDAVGRPVLYQTIPAMDGYHKGPISLYNYPAGIYYIRFKNKELNKLVKIIRL